MGGGVFGVGRRGWANEPADEEPEVEKDPEPVSKPKAKEGPEVEEDPEATSPPTLNIINLQDAIIYRRS